MEENGAYWYLVPGKSFGFASSSAVDLSPADASTTDGQLRLSWHLTGNHGGYRCGELTQLNSSSEYRKARRSSRRRHAALC